MQTTRASSFTRLPMSVAAAAPVVAVCLALAAAIPAEGESYEWDPNGPSAGVGGVGMWDTDPLHRYFSDSGAWVSWANSFSARDSVQFFGSGTVTIDAATIYADRLSFAGGNYRLQQTNSSSVLNLAGGLTIASGRTVTSAVTITGEALALDGGGTFKLGGTDLIGNSTAIDLLGATRINLDGYTATVGGFTLTQGTIEGNGTLTASSYSLHSGNVNAILAGTGSLEKVGPGSVWVRSANTFTGSTLISGGELILSANAGLDHSSSVTVSGGRLTISELTGQNIKRVNVDSGSLLLTGNLRTDAGTHVSNGGRLIGSGFAGESDVTINRGGTIEPGVEFGVGTITTGNLILNSGGTYRWDVQDAFGDAGSDWDLIRANANLTVASTSSDKFIFHVNGLGLAPVVPAVGSSLSWEIARFSSGQLYQTGEDLNSLYDIRLYGTWAAAGLDPQLFSITALNNSLYLTMAVPEPRDYAMILGAITLGLVGYRRWRRTAQSA